jgi:hypothetical protein
MDKPAISLSINFLPEVFSCICLKPRLTRGNQAKSLGKEM